MRLFLTFILCCSSVFVATETAAQKIKDSQHITDVYKLPASIYDVKGMGNWKKGNRAGQIRLVIARSKKRDEVFLQWVQWDIKGPSEVASTVMIREIQDMANFKITYIRRETINGKRQIALGLEDMHDKGTLKAIIDVTDVGYYTCRFQ